MGERPDFEFNFICQNDKLFKIFWGFLLLEYIIECIPESFYLSFSWHMFLIRGGRKKKNKTVLCQFQGLSSLLSCCSCGEVLSKWQHLAQLALDCSSQSGNCAVVSKTGSYVWDGKKPAAHCWWWWRDCWEGCPTAKCPLQPEKNKWSTSWRASKGIGVSLTSPGWFWSVARNGYRGWSIRTDVDMLCLQHFPRSQPFLLQSSSRATCDLCF